jgi:DNA-binding transcriptional ArsR family regulator
MILTETDCFVAPIVVGAPRKDIGLAWGNLSAHLSKLEEAGYVMIEKEFVEKKPHTMVRLTNIGMVAFDNYRNQMRKLCL